MLDIFGIRLKLVQSTSPVRGKLAASVLEADGKARPDLFVWDPMSAILQFEEDRLGELLYAARKTVGGGLYLSLRAVELFIELVNSIRDLFGGSYGGSLGFGGFGGLAAMASAFFYLLATVAAAILNLPFQALAWLLRRRIQSQMRSEREQVLAQVLAFFESLNEPASQEPEPMLN
jgi:hypothetical protein